MMVLDAAASTGRSASERFVHKSVLGDDLCLARHRAFFIVHVIGGVVGVAAVPLVLALGAPVTVATLALFACLAAPLAIAAYLSRTGDLETAHLLSSLSLTALATIFVALTGGFSSFLLPWLVVPPAEAALSGRRRLIVASAIAGGIGLAGLVLLEAFAALPPAMTLGGPAWLGYLLGLGSALGYATLVASQQEAMHRHLEATAREEGDRYRLLAENATDMITRHTRNGNVLFCSEGAERVVGVDPDRLRDGGFFARIHIGDRTRYLKALDDAQISGEPATVELRLRCAGEAPANDAAYVWVEMRCRAIAGENQLVAVTRDISESKEQAAAIERARSEAEQASIAKTRFLASVSHELRTPLNAIIGFSEILSQELFGRLENEKQAEYVNLIRDSGQHLLAVVNDILDMSKIETGRFELIPEPFDIAELVRQCCDMMKAEFERAELTLELDIADNMPEIVGDRRACRQVLFNLLGNAIKFSEADGRIVAGAYPSGDEIVMYIADEGIGIAADDLPRLGQPFVQAHASYDRRYEGTGLGLSVVKGLVHLHGGRLSIASELGLGTRVTIWLPVDCEVRATDGAGDGVHALAPPVETTDRVVQLKRA